jgi:RNA polymerase sigma factor (sigma-70 family)
MPPCEPDQARWFEAEVRPHEAALKGYLQSRFSGLGEVDDVIQETYIRILRAHRIAEVKSAKAFLFTTARNAALDLIRQRRATIPLGPGDGSDLAADAPDAAEQVDHQQELDVLAEAVGRLPGRCREVMLARYRDGLACKEIAQRLELSPETVKVHLARGMRRCAEYFGERGLLLARSANRQVS